MKTENNPAGSEPEAPSPAGSQPPAQRRELLPLPALAAICLYMLVLAVVNALGVVSGQFRPVYLLLSALFIAAAAGLLMLFRWAWALSLGAVVLLACLFFWKFSIQHEFPFAVQGLLNLVFVLYLIRTEVRERLR